MRKYKIGFLDEDEGVRSSVRLFSFLSLISALFIGIWDVINKQPVHLDMIITLLAYSGGTKIAQKYAEVSTNKKEETIVDSTKNNI